MCILKIEFIEYLISQKIASTVEMKDTATDGVKLHYYTACKGTLIQENNKCENLKVGDVVNFIISIEVRRCFHSFQSHY